MSNKNVIIIAEAGVNHNGDLKTAYKMIDQVAKLDIDFIKFQSFVAEELSTSRAKKADYQLKKTENNQTQLQMLKKLEISYEFQLKLKKRCNDKKIKFMSSVFGHQSLEILKKLGVSYIKIPSGEINNIPLLRAVGKLNKNIVLSTGMSNLIEIKEAINVLVLNGTKKKKITVLHCNTEYPTPFKDVNLLAINTISKSTGLNVGYSDHTNGIEASIAAVALGAKVIEKHFTLDKNMNGPDHSSSIEIDELKKLVLSIRNIEDALGSNAKKLTNSEKKNINIVRKSIVASKNIFKGELFSEQNITLKRPGTGIPANKWDKVINKISSRNFKKDDFIKL